MITKDPRKAKSMLKENEDILRESETHLFGKKFRSHMIEIEKSRKKSLEAFKDVGEKKSPFRKGPSHSQNKPYGRGRYYYAGKTGNRDEISGRKFQYGSSAIQGKYLFRKSRGGSFQQQLKTGTTDINDFDTSSSKKIIYRGNTKCTTGRKAISVCKTVEKNYRRPRNFVNSEEVSDTIHKSHSSGEASKHNKMSEQQSLLVHQEISELLEKGAIQKAETAQEEFLINVFLVGKKDRGNRPVINLKKTQCIHLLRALQNERFALSEISSGTKRFPVQDRSQ